MNSALLTHPGFILFEGLDLTGKSSVAEELTRKINNRMEVDAVYSANKGFLLKDPISNEELRGLAPRDKSDFVLDVYSKERLPSEVEYFKEIIQDRHFPTILFYSQIRARQDLSNDSRVEHCLKPKHIFLVESSYECKMERSLERERLEILEDRILSSKKHHDTCQEDYRRIIEGLGIPYTILDTTGRNKDENSQRCLDEILQGDILTHLVDVGQVMVDFESRIYPSTVEIKKRRMLAGEKFSPLCIERRCDSAGNFVDILLDGRHRAYATLGIGCSQYPAYIRHKKIERIDFSSLTKIKDFGFK